MKLTELQVGIGDSDTIPGIEKTSYGSCKWYLYAAKKKPILHKQRWAL